MGEVYRATDLTLGQSVALKFLPHSVALSPAMLEQFHGEVRVARQVSHPNVCRVYDIGEAEGMPFISMEYVDGEDLSSLLRRIGRLPSERGVEIARRICAGLAAAHAKGVIHRDLKPQNIMMNRRGEIFIMDFGLAAIAVQLSGAEARSGTPAYMAPEQQKGTEVTAKSDIYALGLVLFEVFTGRRPFEADSIQKLMIQQEASQFSAMSAAAPELDPAVEKVIRRCLYPDPSKRPSSALAVTSALPGGDPLAMALATGETPSPDVVADSGDTTGLPLRYAVTCLGAVILCVLAAPFLKQAKIAFFQTQLDYPPDVLRQKSRDIAASFGYSRKPADSTIALNQRLDLLSYLDRGPHPRDWARWLGSEAPFTATYREALRPMVASPTGDVTDFNPPPIEPGMVSLLIDGQGRLRTFLAVPYGDAIEPVAPETVFHAAQLDFGKFAEATPQSKPIIVYDQLRAWKGPHPGIPGAELTVEIASWKGRVTSAKVLAPWSAGRGTAPESNSFLSAIRYNLFAFLRVAVLLVAVVLAPRNWRLERADRRGAQRIAAAKFLLGMAGWICFAHLVPNDDSLALATNAIALSLFPAAAYGLDTTPGLFLLTGTRQWFAGIANRASDALQLGLIVFFALFVLRQILRRNWIAAIVAAVIFSLVENDLANSLSWQIELAAYILLFSALIFCLLRFGLVVAVPAVFFLNTINGATVGTDLSTWYAPTGLITLALVLAITLFAFRRCVGETNLVEFKTDAR
jgi:serine/threonine-protein kinase